ncbi:hypothetical protein K491DRAFT_690670 [Lophiostoma macrostomum CBS 122681]|uniref:Uncharacterized protein n=1 Tax=Lophiostoma macrostomum CBS 122681 TaxID=1314788 RepID=A0A6A6TG39_9PLEO|nr:hypothetical protein K491DRAFT_690670 [Lophiostoma macrostomum CBS 122681]
MACISLQFEDSSGSPYTVSEIDRVVVMLFVSWIPMVAPFCGCVFGGFLYDLFIYTGPSPVNTPWLGLKHLFRPSYALNARREHFRREKEEGIV